MATITATNTALTAAELGGPRKVGIWTWTALANGDSGSAVVAPMFPDRTIQVFGTFGTGGTVVIEGSLDGTNYATLTDQSDNALSFTAAKIEAIAPVTLYIRPRVTAGDGTTALTVILLAKGEKF